MKRLDELISKLKVFEENLYATFESVIKENEATFLDLNTEEQLFEQGITRYGVKISDYMPYSPVTIELKQQKNQPYNRVTLRDTEDFHKSFYIDYFTDGFKIWATDEKTNDLAADYGHEIFGLTDENLHEIASEYLLPEIIRQLKAL